MTASLLAFDGWSLAYTPFSPAAIHLLTLLADDSDPDNFLVLLPAPTLHPLPQRVKGFISAEVHPTHSRLLWEQSTLPRLAARAGAAGLHLVTSTPALASPIPITCSPTQWESRAGRGNLPAWPGLSERLRRSLAAGGMHNLRRLDWPADLPVPGGSLPIHVQPVRAHPLFRSDRPALSKPGEFQAAQRPGLPAIDLAAAPFVLYAGPTDPDSIRLLLSGWSWAFPALGDDTFLVLPNLSGAEQAALFEEAAGTDFAATLLPLQTRTLTGLAWLYRQSAAILRLGGTQPWGDPAILTLAAGRPLVALEEPYTVARVGPAAFLTPPDDPRLLGAALVSVITDQAVAEALMNAAQQQVSKWV